MALLADIVKHVTVGAGVRMQALAEAVRDAHGALPIGTGATVGVLGYVLNGGISGYFSRRIETTFDSYSATSVRRDTYLPVRAIVPSY